MAQEAVYELVSSPDLAISTAAKESPEKKPGKNTIHQKIWTNEFLSKECLSSVFLSKSFI
jgi:hypothetical protein